MENGQLINLFITHIDQEGPFLKVWGQAEKTSSVYVEQFLSGASRQFDQGIGTLPPENLQVGSLVGAKYKDGKYYRARILSIDVLNECFIEVSFIDFGHKDIVPAPNLRSLQSFPPTFLSIPPLATSFIFAEVHSPHGGEWNDKVFETIHKELCYREVQCTLVAQATHFYLVKLFIGSSDLGNLFVGRGLMQPISIQAQQAVLLNLSMQKRLTPMTTATVPNEINTYKACTLEPGFQYPVYVSYVNEGPTHFSVQLRQSEDVLVKLMKDINAITLKLLEDVPLPGTICLARCQEDKSICRAVVTNEVDNQFKVFYVDFGNYEVVPLEALYQIPFKFVIPKVMAIRFGLVGIEKSSVTLEMKCAFKKFVDNRLLHMKVLPSPTRMSVSKCELWDPETKVSALEIVQRAALNAYPEPLSLNRGFSQPVKVSYVFSCNRFYVQLVSKELELTNLMAELQASCQNADVMDPAELKAELPCCALFEGDQQWYRSEIVEIVDENNVKVRYIDFGNEEIVPVGLLKMIEGELLTVLRPQAIECCLNGYQNMEIDADRDALLEELILEQQFTMKVVEMMDKKALVELTDNDNYNIASLLLDKIAATKALVSPIIPVVKQSDQQWRSQQNGTEKESFRSERRPPRENNKNWNENRSNDKSWRQENGDSRQDRDSNENTSDSNWRQNNKGYNNRDNNGRRDVNERLRRDNNKNTDSWGGNKDFNSIQEDTEKTPAADNWGSTDNSNQTPVNGPQGDAGWDDVTSQNDSGFKDRAYKKKDGGFRDGGFRKNDDGFRDGGFKKPRDDRFGDRNKRFDNDKDNRYSRDGRGDGGFKKKSDHRRDDNMSSSGSEKSFNKGPRTSSRNDHQRNDRFGGGRNHRSDNKFQNSFGSPEDSWNVSALSLPPMNSAASTDEFLTLDVVGSEAAVTISWFHNPVKFYCQLKSSQTEFKQMMEDMQEFYKGRKPESAVKGSPVVGLFPEDKVLYRGRVLDVFGSQYKVFYVDFGNISTIDKLWPIEKKFMELPAQALLCGLSGIGPPGETWPAANNYEKHFQKESFVARFLYKDEERTHVNLFDGDQELSQLLINDGTAVPLTQAPATTDIEIPLLLGQQFRAIVKSINNLSDIIVALECGLALSCKAHNLELASETYEDNFKAYLEQTVILYVDNILENNVLDATFYDNEGNKINTLIPDEGAFENVEPLCPLLVVSSTLWGYVSHVEENSAFIQPSQFAEAIPVLLEQLFEFYEKQTEESPLIPEEGLLYAARSADSNWYRARVISFDDEKATVSYVDYGNSESLPFSELRELNEQFYLPHVMCIQINTQTPMESFAEKDVVATIYYGESGWEGTLQENPQAQIAPASSEVPLSSESVNTILEVVAGPNTASIPPETATIPEQTGEPTPISETSAIPAESLPSTETLATGSAKGTPVIVSHIDSPNEFYLQRAEASTELDDVQAYLQEVAESLEALESITVGVLCAAPYSVDHQWYRAEVLDADDDITTVRFVDYGNTDVINNKTTRVKTLPPHLLSLAVHATRCSLKAKPNEPDEEWTQTAMECFEELANQEEVLADFVGQDERKNYVELYVHGKSVTEVLVQQNLAKPWEMAVETKSTGFVSHLNSPSEFWIQLESCVDQLEWIAEQLSGAAGFPELEDLSPGTLCAALFADDEMWYRARILSNTVAGIELLFIDYGNSCISSSLRQLPEDLLVTAPLALKCSLQKPAGIPLWNPQACEKFNEISADGQTIFTVKKISTGETCVVDLLLNDASVVESLLPQTVDGHVKNFESLDKFNVETNGEISDSSYKIEPLPGVKWDGQSCIKFKEINNEGSSLFQIEFLTNDTVRIYRDGSDIRIDLGGTKTIETRKTEQVDTENVTSEIDVTEEIVEEYDESQTSYVPSPKKHSSTNQIPTDDSQFCDIESKEVQEQGTNTVEPFKASNFVTPDPAITVAKNADETQTENESLEDVREPVVRLKEQNTQYSAAELLNAETMTLDPDLPTEIENVIETEMHSESLEAEANPEIIDLGPDSVETSLEKDTLKNLESDQVNGPEEEIAISDNSQLDLKETEPIVSKLISEEGTSNEIKAKEKSPSKNESEKLVNADDIPLKSSCNEISGNDEDSKPDDSKTITKTSEIEDKVIVEVKSIPEDTADKQVMRENDPSGTKVETTDEKVEVDTASKIESNEEKSEDDDVKTSKSILPETAFTGENIEESKLIKTVVTDDVTKPIPAETFVIDEHVLGETVVADDVEKSIPAETVVSSSIDDVTKSVSAETFAVEDNVLVETVVTDDVAKSIPAETVVIEEHDEKPKQLAETVIFDEDGAAKGDKSEPSPGSDSRPLSACSGKISHDDRILPGILKPMLAETVPIDENVVKPKPQLTKTAVNDDDEASKGDKSEPSSGSNSRPLSACSGKISHDDRIVPAVLSRPQTPLTSDEEGEDVASKT